ncbi:hypothetical protein EDB89DRAFT_2077820 [Lactarius sanguifluus]|nr:hypothetical protein EDB89DRAFT_2077820 [Lactarius sanguifluus]
MPMPYAERAQSPLYVYPMTPPLALPLPSAPASLRYHIDHTMDSSGSHLLLLHISADPPRPASANPTPVLAAIPRLDCLFPAHPITCSVLSHQQQQQQYPPQQSIGHGTLAARISYHLRAIPCARSVSPPPAPSQSPPPPPTQVEVEMLAPKPMSSPKLVSETLDVDPFAQSFGRVGTRTRSLSVVKLEEMAARAAAETAAADKTPPAPPVPSGKPSGHGELRRPSAKDVFGKSKRAQNRRRCHTRRPSPGCRSCDPRSAMGSTSVCFKYKLLLTEPSPSTSSIARSSS